MEDVFITDLNDILEQVKSLEFKSLTKKQTMELQRAYNTSFAGLKYTTNVYGETFFMCEKSTFKRMLHYAGLEYDEEYLEHYLEYNDGVVACYNDEATKSEELLEIINSIKG